MFLSSPVTRGSIVIKLTFCGIKVIERAPINALCNVKPICVIINNKRKKNLNCILFFPLFAKSISNWECFFTSAILCKHIPPLGPMPNEEIEVSNYEGMEKYRSYTRYLKQAQEAKNKPVWWKTYRSYVEKADPNHGKKGKLGCQGCS